MAPAATTVPTAAIGAGPPVALYIHVPFCVSLCPYCDFVVYTGRQTRGPDARIDAYLGALHTELELRADALDRRFPTRPPLGSVYLGGGTPSLLPAARVAALLERVSARFGIADGAEITLEANPGPDEVGDLAAFRAAGVTRLSLGAQSMDAAELARLGRRHRPTDVLHAVDVARRAGFASVSVDLLYDVPGQTLGTWGATLDAVIEGGVDHVSAYALTLDDPDGEGLTGSGGDHLPVRAGARRWRERARAEQDSDRAADLHALADERLSAAELQWYELSNWSRPGAESRHNLVYWRRLPYEALGPGAHAFDGDRERRWNAARLEGYVTALGAGDGTHAALPPGGAETLSDRDVLVERAMLALRTAAGIDPALATADRVAPAIEWAEEHGLLEAAESGRRLNARGRMLSNELFVRLL